MPFRLCLMLFLLFAGFSLPASAFARFPVRFEEPEGEARLFPEEGTRLQLKCPLKSADPSVQFRWYRDGQALDRHSATLSVPSLSPTDSGLYRCYGFTQLGGAFAPAVNISVQYLAGFEEESDSFYHRKFALNVPFWLRVPRLKAGGNLAQLQWKWTKQGGQELLSDGTNYFVSAEGDLLLLDPDESAVGEYSVEVTDGKKQFSSRKFRLEIDPNAAPVTEPTFAIVQRPQDSRIHPSAYGQPSEQAKFECVPNLARKYEVEIRWHLNGELLQEGGLVGMELGGRLLNLVNPSAILGRGTRSAVVRCEARARTSEGGLWLDQADARLDILESPHINRAEWAEELAKEEGESLDLICHTDRGWPRPKLAWYFNDQKIEGANAEHMLITHLNGQHFGVFQCEAMNAAGLDIVAVLVKRLSGEGREEAGISANATAHLSLLPVQLGNPIELGPVNQSEVIGSNVQMPCRLRKGNGEELRVVWSRNGEEIPAEGDLFRRISIDEEGTLWINQVGPDSIGQYRCTARDSNGQEKGTQHGWLSIIEKPGMVQNVRAELVNDSSGPNGNGQERIRVQWGPGFDGNSPVTQWSVQMRTLGPNGFWSDWEEGVELLAQLQHGEPCCASFVENVRPAATAEFRVLAHNRLGPGKPSAPSDPVTMPQQAPTAAPSKVHASARSAQSIMVQWQAPEQADQPEAAVIGEQIRGYVVRYRLSGYAMASWHEKNVSDGQARNALVEPLITWREYDIQVAAYNDRGLGVFSRLVSVSTLEGVPMQSPQNVHVKVLNSTAIHVEFEAPSPQMIPGVNLGYKLQLWHGTPGLGEPARVERLFPKAGSRLGHQIGGLDKFGLYNLTVLCFTAPGDGPRSEPLEFRTAEDLPGPVQSLEAVEVFSESALLQWTAPEQANGQIQKYSLEWTELEGKGEEKGGKLDISGHSLNFTLEGLKAQRKYRAGIQAFTRVGPGLKLETTFESGIPPELPGRPSALSISEVGARKARVHFMAGTDGHSQIKKWLVEARIGPSASAAFSPLAEFTSMPRGTNSLLILSLRPHSEYQLRLIAENVRGRSQPSEPSPVFKTQQSAPEHAPRLLWADPVSAGQISLVWVPLLSRDWNGDEPRAYLLLYRGVPLGGGQNANDSLRLALEQAKWEELRILGPRQHQHLLGGLRPYSLYQLQMLAENGVGRSEPSAIVEVATHEGIPLVAPVLKAELTAQGGIEASWEAVEGEQANGRVEGYRVILLDATEKGEPEHILEQYIGADQRRSMHFPSSMLRPNSLYSVTVQAETVIGPGPRQERAKPLATPEDVPDAPANASFVYKSPSELRLGWSHPKRPKGRILHYGVLYWRHNEPKPSVPFTEIPPNLDKFTATHLRPNSTYFFALKAQSAIGWGPERMFRVSTARQNGQLPLAPVPSRDTSKPQSATALHLKWPWIEGEGDEQSSPARAIELQWQMANQEGWTGLEEYIPVERNSHSILKLHPNSAYRVQLRLQGDLAQSAWSTPSDWMLTMEAAPARAPADLQVEAMDERSLRISWQPLARQDWNADRIGYRVEYRIYQPANATVTSPGNASSSGMEEVPLGERGNEHEGRMEVRLAGLESLGHYLVQVRAFNVLGQSAISKPPRFITLGPPRPERRVRNVHSEALSSTSIRVRWEPMEGAGLTGYRVRWLQTGPKHGQAEHQEELTLVDGNEHILTDLHKWSEYRIQISGYSRAGEGPLAAVTARTLEDLPGPVGPLQFRDILLESIKVLWSAPEETNGNLTGFVLLYRTSRQRAVHGVEEGKPLGIGELFPRKEVQLRTEQAELHLDQLEENVTYFVSVRAETAAGLGAERTAEVTTGFNTGAPDAPTRPEVISEQRDVLIRWSNGPSGNGPIIGHLVQAKRVGTALGSFQMDEKRSLVPALPKRPHRSVPDQQAGKRPRHVIGHFVNVGLLNSGPDTSEWRIPYKELEPSSFYTFRVFARNELGIGRPSLESGQLHVPASIPAEPFYAEWWFLTLVGLFLAIVVLAFVGLLYLTGRRSGQTHGKEAIEKRKRRKSSGGRAGGKSTAGSKSQEAFDTLQLSDGGIVSYELYTKRNERGDELLFSRPNTKQSWVGSLRDSPAAASSRSAGIGIYGSIDGEKAGRTKGGGAGGGSQLPNMYSALCTDSMPMLAAGSRNGSLHTLSRPLAPENADQSRQSPPYYQLRQFNVASRLGPHPFEALTTTNGIYSGANFAPPSLYGPTEPSGEDGMPSGHVELENNNGTSLYTGHHYQQRNGGTTNRRRTEAGTGIPLSSVVRSRTPTALFGCQQQQQERSCLHRRSRSSSEPDQQQQWQEEADREATTTAQQWRQSSSSPSSSPFPPASTSFPQSQRNSNELAGLSSFV